MVATVNRNIGYPRFRTHGSVSVRLFQISVRFRFVFFLTINVVKQTFLLETLIEDSPVIIILLLSFKERENMVPSCKFKSPVWEHFDFFVAILLLFYVCRWKKNTHYEYMFWMWNTNSIQLLEPNRNNRKLSTKIKTEPNRKNIWTVAALLYTKLRLCKSFM